MQTTTRSCRISLSILFSVLCSILFIAPLSTPFASGAGAKDAGVKDADVLTTTDDRGNTFYKRLNAAEYGKCLDAIKVPGSLKTLGLAQRGKYLYTCGDAHFTIYDISEPTNPVMTARVENISSSCRQIRVYKNLACITARTDGLYIFDIADPKKPKLLCRYDTMELATGLACDNDIAYVCQRQYGTEFIDISDPEHPKHLGFVISGEAQSVDTANGVLYAGDWATRRFSVFDVRNPGNPRFIADVAIDGLGDGVYVRDGIGYAGTGQVQSGSRRINNDHEGNGLDIISLADITAPKVLGRVRMPVQAFTIYPDLWSVVVNEDKMAYVNNTYNGIFCIDVSDPANPKPVAYSIPWNEAKNRPDFMGSLAVVDEVIYAAGNDTGLWVIPAKGIAKKPGERANMPVPPGPVAGDVPSNEDRLSDFVFYRANGQIGALCRASDGKSLWVAAGMDGIHRLEIRGNEPVLLQKVATRGVVCDVKRVGNTLYTAECDKGFALYETDKDGDVKETGRFVCDTSVRQVVVTNDARWAILKTGNATLRFIDLADPKAPKEVMRDTYPLGIMYGREIVNSVTDAGIAAALFWHYGFAWYDLSGESPQKRGMKPGRTSFANGGAFHDGKMFFWSGKGYYIVDPLDTTPYDRAKFCPLPSVDHGGKIFIDGNKAAVVMRWLGLISTFDLTNPDKPKLLEKYKIKGHPDPGVFLDGRLIVPCGYAGLMIEKVKR